MQKSKKILLFCIVLLILLVILLTVWLIRINFYGKNAKLDAVIIEKQEIGADDSVSFVLANYKAVAVNCSAVLEITQNSSLVFTTKKYLGIIKPRQSIKGRISEFRMPDGTCYIKVLANCTNL